MKDKNKQTVLTEAVIFDHQRIYRITFALVHINQGWDDQKGDYAYRNRSSYIAADIVELFEQFKYFFVEWVIGINKEIVKIKGINYYRYHWQTTDDFGEIIRVVFDLPFKNVGEGIIVTVFKDKA